MKEKIDYRKYIGDYYNYYLKKGLIELTSAPFFGLASYIASRQHEFNMKIFEDATLSDRIMVDSMGRGLKYSLAVLTAILLYSGINSIRKNNKIKTLIRDNIKRIREDGSGFIDNILDELRINADLRYRPKIYLNY